LTKKNKNAVIMIYLPRNKEKKMRFKKKKKTSFEGWKGIFRGGIEGEWCG